ncbi:MAG: c-type cytochrome biogenesis protein CcmI, partial [bacterium]
MGLFLLFAGGLVVASILILSPALFSRSTIKNVDLEKQNLEITRQRLNQLSPDSASVEAQQELEAALLDDLSAPDYNLEDAKSRGVKTAIILLVIIPVAAFSLYGALGNPAWQN